MADYDDVSVNELITHLEAVIFCWRV